MNNNGSLIFCYYIIILSYSYIVIMLDKLNQYENHQIVCSKVKKSNIV